MSFFPLTICYFFYCDNSPEAKEMRNEIHSFGFLQLTLHIYTRASDLYIFSSKIQAKIVIEMIEGSMNDVWRFMSRKRIRLASLYPRKPKDKSS